jgi:hypothetical protein
VAWGLGSAEVVRSNAGSPKVTKPWKHNQRTPVLVALETLATLTRDEEEAVSRVKTSVCV